MLSALIQLTTTQRETIQELDGSWHARSKLIPNSVRLGDYGSVLLISPPATSCQALFRPPDTITLLQQHFLDRLLDLEFPVPSPGQTRPLRFRSGMLCAFARDLLY